MHSPSFRHGLELSDALKELSVLYDREYPNGAPQFYERLLHQGEKNGSFKLIAQLLRRKLSALVQYETDSSIASVDMLLPQEKAALSIFLNPQVLQTHMEVGRDAVLSNETHTIAHYETQQMVVAHDFITAVQLKKPEILTRRGAIFFDVDGTKTIVDCTSHAHAGRYLEGLAHFFYTLTPELHAWLHEHHIHAEAFSYAGDEFVMMLRSEEDAITKEVLDEFAQLLQMTLAKHEPLSSHISFDDPEFVMEYDEWTDEDRAAYASDQDSMQERLRESRSKLPNFFTPSVSFGSATLMKGLEEALSPDTETAATLDELSKNAFRLMVERADARMKEDKRIFRESMEDPLWKNFLLRNAENRRLQQEIDKLRAELYATLEENQRLKAEKAQSDAIIFHLQERVAQMESQRSEEKAA